MLGGLQIDLSQYGMDIIKPLAGMFVDLQAYFLYMIGIQSTLVISNSKGLYETLRDIRSSAYQIYGTEEKTINRTTTFNRMNT